MYTAMHSKHIPLIILVFLVWNISILFAQEGIQQIIYTDPVQQTESQQNNNEIYSASTLWYTLYTIHMTIGIWLPISSWNFLDLNYVQLINELRNTMLYNVMDLLEFEQDKWKIMNQYLDVLDSSLIKSDFALMNIEEEMSLLTYNITSCSVSKRAADKTYVDSINSLYEPQFMNESLQESIKYGECISDNKIQYNAKKILSDKIAFYRSLLKIKYDYLFANKDLIVDHYVMIKNDLLQRLLNLKTTLQKYDF